MSPLELGRAKFTSPPATGSQQTCTIDFAAQNSTESPEKPSTPSALTLQFASTTENLCRPIGSFQYRSGALCFLSENGQGEPVSTVVTNYPVYVAGVNRGEVKQDSYSIALKHKPPHEDWQTTEIPLRMLFSSSGMAEVLGRGIIVHESDLFKKFLRESIDLLNAEGKADVQFEQFGWKEDETAFLVGKSLYTKSRVREAAGNAEVTKRARDLGIRPGGNLAEWKAAADQLFAVGCEPQGFALLCSFAAPLMRFLSHDEGGAVISITSRASGTGKSTALAAVASVWGQLAGLHFVNIDTKVSKGIVMGVLGNLPIIYDELSNRDPEIVKEFIETFTNGRDKMRGTGEGQIIHTACTWQTLLISGNNKSLVDTVRAAKGSDAMNTRIIEFAVELPDHIKHAKGDGLKEALYRNAGWAGDAYMRALVQPETIAYVKKSLPIIYEQIVTKYGFRSEHRFWARTLAAVAVASVIVKHLGLVSFSPDRIQDWAIRKLTDYKDMDDREAMAGSEMLARFLSSHIANMLIMPCAWKPGGKQVRPLKEPMRSMLIRVNVAENQLFIEQKALRAFMSSEGVSWRDFVLEMKSKGVLTTPHRLVTLSAGTDVPGLPTPCIELSTKHPLMSGMLAEVSKLNREKTA